LSKRFAGDGRLIEAAYNAGEGTVDRYAGVPPYPETQQYVRRVLRFAGYPQRDRSNPGGRELERRTERRQAGWLSVASAVERTQ
jgi:hypothetical protein